MWRRATRWCFFADGITEAINNRYEEWGEENLIAVMERSDHGDPEAMVKAVFQSADEFVEKRRNTPI